MQIHDGESATSVVVGFDNSRYSRRALDAAADTAQLRGVRLVVLLISPSEQPWGAQLRDRPGRPPEAVAATTRALARVADRHPALSVEVVRARRAGAETVRLLAETAELLVLGQRGVRGQRSLSSGSVSEELARQFPCPLLIVHDGYECLPRRASGDAPWGRVVAGIDGLGEWGAVLAVAVHEADLRAQPLVVVHAASTGPVMQHGTDHVTASVFSALSAANAEVGSSRSTHSVVLSDEEPLSALVDHVTSLDLLVIGSSASGGVAGPVRRSVSRAVLGAAPCDVLVVQPRAGHPAIEAPGEPPVDAVTSLTA